MSTTIKSTIVSLRRPLKRGDKVQLGWFRALTYKITRIEGLSLFGTLDGQRKERCITADYKRPRADFLRVTHADGKHIE